MAPLHSSMNFLSHYVLLLLVMIWLGQFVMARGEMCLSMYMPCLFVCVCVCVCVWCMGVHSADSVTNGQINQSNCASYRFCIPPTSDEVLDGAKAIWKGLGMPSVPGNCLKKDLKPFLIALRGSVS